jgi:hypothetical protein
MVDWLIISIVYFLPMLAVMFWLAIVVPRLVSGHPQPSASRERSGRTAPDAELPYDRVRKLDYFVEKERRDEALLEALQSTAKAHVDEELRAAARLAEEMQASPGDAAGIEDEERRIGRTTRTTH